MITQDASRWKDEYPAFCDALKKGGGSQKRGKAIRNIGTTGKGGRPSEIPESPGGRTPGFCGCYKKRGRTAMSGPPRGTFTDAKFKKKLRPGARKRACGVRPG